MFTSCSKTSDSTAAPEQPGDTACVVVEQGVQSCLSYSGAVNASSKPKTNQDCNDHDGKFAPRCPTDNLLGFCERAEDRELVWTLYAMTRRHYYLPAERTAERSAAAARLAKECSAYGRWVPHIE